MNEVLKRFRSSFFYNLQQKHLYGASKKPDSNTILFDLIYLFC